PGTNLALIAAAAVEELRIAHPQARVTVEAPREVMGDWDPDRMAQVVSNLVANGIQHGAGAEVEVRVKSANASAILEVHNGGPPIPPDLLPRIFGPFRRGAKTGAKQAGGLGLGSSSRGRSSLHTAGRSACARRKGTGRPSPSPCRRRPASEAELRGVPSRLLGAQGAVCCRGAPLFDFPASLEGSSASQALSEVSPWHLDAEPHAADS